METLYYRRAVVGELLWGCHMGVRCCRNAIKAVLSKVAPYIAEARQWQAFLRAVVRTKVLDLAADGSKPVHLKPPVLQVGVTLHSPLLRECW